MSSSKSEVTVAPTQPHDRAGRNLVAATGVGLVLGGLVLGSLFVRKELFVGLVAIAVVLAIWELATALASGGPRVALVPIAFGAAVMVVAAFVAGPDGLLVAATVTVLVVLVWRLPAGVAGYVRDVTASTFIVLYVPLLAGFTMLMLRADDGPVRLVVFFLVTVCSDVGGYAAGVTLGRHPMAPSVSPRKSWEGFAGSVTACAVGGALSVVLLLDGLWWQGVLVGLAAVCTATLGDLAESMVKRDLGLKDMGSLLPGHGGLMDRLDSLLPTAPVVYTLLAVFVAA
ncbi:MAG TPA: phosphatidate cytidylyltransferase [Actinomycetes bacterium]|nr:phosphatidate cytidylyltransferase [Actinomycetes bacterium]